MIVRLLLILTAPLAATAQNNVIPQLVNAKNDQLVISSTLSTPTTTTSSTTEQITSTEAQIPTTSIAPATKPLNTSTTTTTTPKPLIPDCFRGVKVDSMSQDIFSTELTSRCGYDRLTKPETDGPLNVTVQIDIRHIENLDQLQFKMHMLIQYKYLDQRLIYYFYDKNRGIMVGEDKLRDKIWIPHIILSNEKETSIMGLEGKDVFVSINPYGEVIYSYRMTATFYCWMNLKKFPFDEQTCEANFKSWTYNASDLLLHWEDEKPVMVASQLHLTEFTLTNYTTMENTVNASFSRGVFVGEYSNLVFKFYISREIGYYILDYFIPSIMLVCISWVTFWLQADAAAPRVALGTTTILSFITLASGQGKHLPKVSYIKASEIWFLGCSFFIFASIAEFAFVNIIWRRKEKVELKKINSKYILKTTFTPKLARKELQKSNSMQNLHRTQSCSSLDAAVSNGKNQNGQPFNNYLTVHSFPRYAIPKITMQSDEDLMKQSQQSSNFSITIPPDSPESSEGVGTSWATMTPQEISIWIDTKARFVFPLGFLVFNIFYWSFVYAL